MMSLSRVTVLASLSILLACKNFSTKSASELEVFGVTKAVSKLPPLRSPAVINRMQKNVAQLAPHSSVGHSKGVSRQHLQNVIMDQITEIDGVPRVQLHYILKDLVAKESTHCAGISCARVFNLEEEKIDDFLDLAKKNIEDDPRLKRAEHEDLRDTLLGSLTKQSDEQNLQLGEPHVWLDFVTAIASKGTKDDALRSSLVPTMLQFDESLRTSLLATIAERYQSAYKVKFKATSGLAPKRAYDVILRFTAGPEKFFKDVATPEETLTAWRKYFNQQKATVFRGSDFGAYAPDDVLSVARRMQQYLISQGSAAKDVHILLKGSFPSGKANLRKKNPFDNLIDSIMTGFETSYSDIDFLINDEWQKPIKAIEPEIYSALVSKEAKDIVRQSKAKAFFQTHPDPFDLFAELDGSIMSPVGLRINQKSLTLVVYNALPATDLPSREAIAKMTPSEKKAVYDRWASFYPL